MPARTAFPEEIGDGYVLGAVRVALGALLGWRALLLGDELARAGYFGDFFHVAMIPEGFVPPAKMYGVLLAARLLLAMMIMFGVWARPALALSAIGSMWLMLCDRLHVRDGEYSLACYALLLSLTPCDASWRMTEAVTPRTGPFWAVTLCQLQVSLVYLASGGWKLLDPDWRGGHVLAARLAGLRLPLDAASALAKLAIMSELVICVALWLRPTRAVALWWGLWLHLVVLVGLRGQEVVTSSLLTLAMYGVFATPDFHARTLRFDPSRFWGKTAGTLVPWLDWLGRFEVRSWQPDDRPGHSLVLVRRDGERVTGVRALAMLARCVPVLFPLWAPIALVASFTRQGDLTSAS
ncbi:MAG: hypothetical protein JWP97_1044 [Labilithrix sp.]|nr:hypothetical protein [Labilithrix sp.]